MTSSFSAGSGGPLLFSGVPPCAAVQRPPQVRNMMYSHFIDVKRRGFLHGGFLIHRKKKRRTSRFICHCIPFRLSLRHCSENENGSVSGVPREFHDFLGNHPMASIFDVKALLKERRQMSVKDISYHFRIPDGTRRNDARAPRRQGRGKAHARPTERVRRHLQSLHGPGKPRLSMVRTRLTFSIRVATP